MKPQPKTVKFDGLGTHWECEILDDNFSISRLKELEVIIANSIKEFDKLYSRFDKSSIVWALNTQHKIANPPLEMRQMMKFARKMSELTDGVFDISVGGELSNIGYGELSHSKKVSHDFWQKTTISSRLIETPEDSTIDFGGFGKGWLIDKLVKQLRSLLIRQFILNGGGDLYVQSDKPIEILLEHPLNKNDSIGQTRITSGALAASSTIKRSWQDKYQPVHHIINPFTGKPSDGEAVGTFIKAESALIADVMATVLIIRPELEMKLADKLNFKAIIIKSDQLKVE